MAIRQETEEASARFRSWIEVCEKAAIYAVHATEGPKKQRRERSLADWKAGRVACGTVGKVCYTCAHQPAPPPEDSPVEELVRTRVTRASSAQRAKDNEESRRMHAEVAERIRAECAPPRGVSLEGRPGGISIHVDGLKEDGAVALLKFLATR